MRSCVGVSTPVTSTAILRWYLVFCSVVVLYTMLGYVGCSQTANPSETTNIDGGDESSHILDGNHPLLPESPIEAGANLPATTQKRQCPDQLTGSTVFSFQGSPGKTDGFMEDDDAKGGCVPKNIPSGVSQAPNDFLSDCNKPEVLCVGTGQEVKTLTEAAKQTQSDVKITHIKIVAGTYQESVVFQNIQQDLLIEGQSNDPKLGTILHAPTPTGTPAEEYAALTVNSAKKITLQRLVFTGEGHGLYAKNVTFVIVNNNEHTACLRTGATFINCETIEIVGNRFVQNGSLRGDKFVKEARFGLVVQGSQQVLLRNNEITRNAAGGVRVSHDPIGVIVNNNERVAGNDTVSVIVNNNERVAMESNHIHHNGPVNWSPKPSTGEQCPQTGCSAGKVPPCCAAGTFCEKSACHPDLRIRDQNRDLFLGVGTVIAGLGQVELRGNSFYGNDTAGIFVHSARTVVLQNNALERNGVRANSSSKTIGLFSESAIKIWNIAEKLDIRGNLLVDNVSTGIRVTHVPPTNPSVTKMALEFQGNHVAGNGRFARTSDLSEGDGLLVITDQQRSTLSLLGKDNYFANNGRTGFFFAGSITGSLSDNVFDKHSFPAIVLRDTGATSNPFVLNRNSINGARRYGIQVFQGAAQLTISNNAISNLQAVGSGADQELEADSIILQGLQQGGVKVESNRIENTESIGRVGILVDNSKVEVANNLVKGSQFGIVAQNGTQLTGSDAKAATNPAKSLSTREPEKVKGP